ncbi:ABC transporter ATP-binding protein [Sphaerisporangium siamense]|uniref:Branched-chain amino acid transport system ATP-binding protein n=1 Tax=Sphaerisporangium siamense TaxID=795645 RepID=A0A7W7D3I2_9ACTN|nr:ABC transporter ATP-binding protein [Sphaerisporangium siamense]MBB4699660.1 branched-chain amino acid transport system ATP-binding protein [Sphaerisporangium siamense]GII87838.1 ABC transporter ATP-binding protein [Sphaerisporangium siamense]
MLSVTGVTGGYGDLRVLWDVDVAVRPGRITVVLGRNGAGKTSLLSAIAGLLPTVSQGRVELDGRDLSGAAAHRRVRAGLALVQENKRVFRARSVEENLLLGGYSLGGFGLRGGARGAALEKAYERFPVLRQRRREPAGSLSGGQQQMLAIGQALMPGPKLLMLDEPSAGLAPAIVNEVLEMVAALRDEGLSILLVEQRIEHALAIADDVAVMENGRIITTGPKSAFDDGAVIREVYLGRSGERLTTGNH